MLCLQVAKFRLDYHSKKVGLMIMIKNDPAELKFWFGYKVKAPIQLDNFFERGTPIFSKWDTCISIAKIFSRMREELGN